MTRGLVSLVVAVLTLPWRGASTPAFPAPLDRYLSSYVKLAPDARARLLRGEPVTKMLDSDASKEVAVFGALWIDAPVDDYLAAVKDIERFESGGAFRVTKKISSPPALEDFAQLTIPADDVEDLKSCTVGKCEIKLSQNSIERIRREVDWSSPGARDQVNALIREIVLGYVQGYLEGGNARLAVYRDGERPTFVAKEFSSMIDRLPSLTDYLPGVKRYLLDFPNATLPNSDSFLYWQEATFGLKPTIRINHMVIAKEPDGAAIASKMLYASHYFWTALELRIVVRDKVRGPGFWLITESRSRSDGLSGFVGRFVRGKARGEAEKGAAAVLRLTKERLEKK